MAETQDLVASRLFDTTGFVCLVTGGGTGIGLMISQALAANGAKVYITGRRMDVLQSTAAEHTPKFGAGQIIPAGPCDVTDKKQLEKLYKEISGKEKYLDLVVANAGIAGEKTDPDESDAQALKDKLWAGETVEGWGEVYTSDVTSVFFTTVCFLPLLQAASQLKGHLHASVITTSSMSGILRDAQAHFSYNAAKGATIQLTRLMSKEFMKTGIRINSIAPGYFPSELTMGESNERQKTQMPNKYTQDKGNVPKEVPGADEEMAMTALYFAKNRYVMGEVIAVDGGVLNVSPGR